jgi:apolipoprotein D and lipocalin family protein
MIQMQKLVLLLPLLLVLVGCTGVPKGLTPVTEFESDRYLGKWYEIARLDHRFERGLSDVTATYTRRPDGSIAVVNKGWDDQKERWRTATGTARFRGDESVGSLKVSFSWIASGGYHVIALDRENYEWAMVAGPTRDYLWILARQPRLDPQIQAALVEQAAEAGFKTEELIFVSHKSRK